MTDIAIRNALILDGSGGEGFEADIGISDGMIETIGVVGASQTEINGAGMCLAPGLIDTHAHDDGAFLRHPDMTFKLSQGSQPWSVATAGSVRYLLIRAPTPEPPVAESSRG